MYPTAIIIHNNLILKQLGAEKNCDITIVGKMRREMKEFFDGEFCEKFRVKSVEDDAIRFLLSSLRKFCAFALRHIYVLHMYYLICTNSTNSTVLCHCHYTKALHAFSR